MRELNTIPDVIHLHCPFDDIRFGVLDYYIPGMRNWLICSVKVLTRGPRRLTGGL